MEARFIKKGKNNMGAPKIGTPERARYSKKQYEFRKRNYYTINIDLKYGEDDDLIYNLTNFKGSRNSYVKNILRKQLKADGLDSYDQEAPAAKEPPDTSDLQKEIKENYDQYLHRHRR